ncbi:RDD family protein [Candidatus Poriferisodalis sp.]|uniref:RDD family protein n=1 Tax=Candidatus Poriferisodalis sp. TaxID=3101277 RepID=UPI003B01527C
MTGCRDAPLVSRLSARFLDMVVHLAVIVFIVVEVIAPTISSPFIGTCAFGGCAPHVPGEPWTVERWTALVALLALLVLYEPVMVALWGATVGKLAVGLRVVRIADGTRPGLFRSLVRVLVPSFAGVSTLGVGWFIVWFILVWSTMSGQDRRGWHDKLSGTVVVTRASALSLCSGPSAN